MNDEYGDVGDDEDGDGRLAWEGILGSIRTDQSSETYPIGFFQLFRNHTILEMSALSTPLSGRVVYKWSALDHDGITQWDGRNHQTARANWQKPYPSAQEVREL